LQVNRASKSDKEVNMFGNEGSDLDRNATQHDEAGTVRSESRLEQDASGGVGPDLNVPGDRSDPVADQAGGMSTGGGIGGNWNDKEIDIENAEDIGASDPPGGLGADIGGTTSSTGLDSGGLENENREDNV
jgi:hypothetical protein